MDAEPPNHKDDISAIPAPVSLVPGVLSHAFDPNDTPPPNIEGYEVLNYLGEGASGIVWRATQLSTGRQVALKLMGGAVFGTEKAKARFEREVELAARLNHPNIARLYESGIRHGYYYYAMELIEGLPLDEYAKQHHLSQDKIVVLMQKVCNAIQHAHACGVIHRDLKPSNILVSADGEPHVLDFGLAKAAAQRRSNITVTIDGQAAGTVAYMSPEQAAGKLDEIGIGSDIYSLGVILFELLTGDYPHEQSDSIYEQLVRVVRDEPRPPRSLNPAIDKDLEAIILKAISPHPQDRYAIAVEFARDLENYLAGDAVQARPLTLPYFIGKRIRKHRGRVALISAILIVFAATLAIAYVRVAHERDYANQQADAANQALYFNHIALATSELEKHHIGRTRELLQQCPAALRNWEWRYLFAASDQSIKTFNTGEGRIRTMAVNGQGNLVYGKNQKQICIMRLSDGDILISRDIDYDHLAISVDGGFCVVATGTQLRILDIDSLRDRRPAIELSQPIAEITVSPDGWIAAGYATGGFIVLDSNGVVLHEWAQSPLRGQLRWMTGHRLAGFAGQAIEVVDASNGDMQVQRLYKDRWGAIAEHLNEHGIGAASIGGVVRRLDSGGNSLWTTNLGQSSVLSIASDSSGTWLATGDAQGSICLWTDAMIEPSRILAGHDASVTGICFGINSSQLISADHKGVIKVWQLGEEHSQTRTIQMPGLVSAFAASTAGNVYAVGLDSGEVLVRDTAVPSQWTLFPGNTSVCMLAFDATGHWLCIGDVAGQCSVWNRQTRTCIYRFDCGQRRPSLAQFSPNGQWLALACAGDDPEIRVLNFRQRRTVAQVPGFPVFAWSNESSVLIASSEAHSLQQLDTHDWEIKKVSMRLPQGALPERFATLNDGNLIVLLTQGRLYRVNTRTGELVSISSPLEDIGDMCVSADEKRLFVATTSTVKIIDTSTGTLVYSLMMPDNFAAHSVALVNGDQKLVVAGGSEIKIYNTGTQNAPRISAINRH